MTKPLVFQPGAAEIAFRVVLGVWAAFEVAMALRQRHRLGHRRARDPSALALGSFMAAAILAAEGLGRAGVVPWPGGRLWPVVAGLCLVAAGLGLRAWSIATLGRFFQYRIEVQDDHRVVTSGPYRHVRHPSYTGVALALVGLALAAGSVLGLVATVALGGAGLAVRIRAEERQLTDALGPQYEEFASTRKRLIPRVL